MRVRALIFAIALAATLAFCLTACVPPPDHPRPGLKPGPAAGPLPWAPPAGRPAKYVYRYWAGPQVYFDMNRNIYFWRVAGGWHSGPALPGGIIVTGDGVPLHMDTPHPWRWHKHVIRRYPPR